MEEGAVRRFDVERARIGGQLLRARHSAQHLVVERAGQHLPVRAKPGVAQTGGADAARAGSGLAQGMERLARFHDPRVVGAVTGGVAERREEAVLAARPEERAQEAFRAFACLELERDPGPPAAQASPELVPLDGDPLSVEKDDQPARRVGGMEPRVDPGLQAPEDLVDLLTPAGQEAFPPEQGLGRVLELAGIASPHVAAAGLGLEARHAGERLDQLGAGPGSDAVQQRGEVRLLGGEERRPSLRLDADERLEGHGQAREEVAVPPEQRRRLGRWCVDAHVARRDRASPDAFGVRSGAFPPSSGGGFIPSPDA